MFPAMQGNQCPVCRGAGLRHPGGVDADGFVDRTAPTERLALDDTSWVDVTRGWMPDADAVFEHLLAEVPWQTSQLFRYDHLVEERRLGAGWRPGRPLPHPALAEATRLLQHRYDVRFDGFAMALYRDGRDGQAFHRDTDMRYLDDTFIGILTLGAQRPWRLRPITARHTDAPGKGAVHDLSPASGDLLVLGGRCQSDWEHSVPYLGAHPVDTHPVGPRLSVQWRFARRQGRPHVGASYRAPRFYGRADP